MSNLEWQNRSSLSARGSCRLLLAALLLILAIGCRKADGPPPPLTLEELPPALEKAFAKSKSDAGESLSSALAALREKDYSKALMSLQAVGALAGLNREQANVVAAGLVTVNNALQEAQSHGDQNAAQTLQTYRSTK
jgi:hypothetical protein